MERSSPQRVRPLELATFAAGCFWGVEATFRAVGGVVDAAVGFMGGSVSDPSYRRVCEGDTGHAEVVQLRFDPERVGYDELLTVFWSCHDPTTRDRQGPDVGTQYRSAIFYHTPEQQRLAQAALTRLEQSDVFGRPIVTEITAAGPFFRAEEHHQRYLEKRGLGPSCSAGRGPRR